MNFFEHQDRARASTTRLVFLFTIAVGAIVVALYVASRIVLRYAFASSVGPYAFPWWDAKGFVIIAVAAVLLVGTASLVKTLSLRQGGAAVARMLGGRPISPNTSDPEEMRFRNVVEEMAIASGVPVPEMFVLDREEGINAFAAGFTPGDAAVAVTRGTLRTLNRDELQGVVAHEFSHILNGDMRLNVRLIGILFGILVIGIIGRVLTRTTGRVRQGSKRGLPVIAIAGLLLFVIGYVGVLVGRMIQSAVSRQREFLADASAVQFTRNPRGIGGALKKIGGYRPGSRLEAPNAEQAGHLFFGQGTPVSLFARWMATHPPLAERIRRIDPHFDGRFPDVFPEQVLVDAAVQAFAGFAPGESVRVDPVDVVGRVGSPTPEHLAAGLRLRERIPQEARSMASSPGGAKTLLFALLLDEREELRREQIESLGLAECDCDAVRHIDPRLRLPIADLALPSIKQLSPGETADFLEKIDALVLADRETTLFEFCLRWIVRKRLAIPGGAEDRILHRSLGPLLGDAAVVLGALAREGNPGDSEGARQAFQAGAARLVDPAGTALPFRPGERTDLRRLGKALDRFAHASFRVREKVIDGCAHAAFADRSVSIEEADLLRVVGFTLDCPLPPFLKGKAA